MGFNNAEFTKHETQRKLLCGMKGQSHCQAGNGNMNKSSPSYCHTCENDPCSIDPGLVQVCNQKCSGKGPCRRHSLKPCPSCKRFFPRHAPKQRHLQCKRCENANRRFREREDFTLHKEWFDTRRNQWSHAEISAYKLQNNLYQRNSPKRMQEIAEVARAVATSSGTKRAKDESSKEKSETNKRVRSLIVKQTWTPTNERNKATPIDEHVPQSAAAAASSRDKANPILGHAQQRSGGWQTHDRSTRYETSQATNNGDQPTQASDGHQRTGNNSSHLVYTQQRSNGQHTSPMLSMINVQQSTSTRTSNAVSNEPDYTSIFHADSLHPMVQQSDRHDDMQLDHRRNATIHHESQFTRHNTHDQYNGQAHQTEKELTLRRYSIEMGNRPSSLSFGSSLDAAIGASGYGTAIRKYPRNFNMASPVELPGGRVTPRSTADDAVLDWVIGAFQPDTSQQDFLPKLNSGKQQQLVHDSLSSTQQQQQYDHDDSPSKFSVESSDSRKQSGAQYSKSMGSGHETLSHDGLAHNRTRGA